MPIAIGKNGTTRGKNRPNLWFQCGRDACRRTPGSKNCIRNRPGRTRTCDPLLRRQMLYPPELRAQIVQHAMQEFNIAITDKELWDYMRFNSEERTEPEANTPARRPCLTVR